MVVGHDAATGKAQGVLQQDGAITVRQENALMDTARPVKLGIPNDLRSSGDPGAWIVQARGPIDNAFRATLKAAGAQVVSYIPNNAYLVRATTPAAQQLSDDPRTQIVLPYEPYYKLSPLLLDAAFLVPRSRAKSFQSLMAREAKALGRHGYGVTLTGPWPPYSFVQD